MRNLHPQTNRLGSFVQAFLTLPDQERVKAKPEHNRVKLVQEGYAQHMKRQADRLAKKGDEIRANRLSFELVSNQDPSVYPPGARPITPAEEAYLLTHNWQPVPTGGACMLKVALVNKAYLR